MGVYNPNMEIPKNCHECDYFTTAYFGHYGELQWLKCRIIDETVKAYYNECHPNCPLKEIPTPHGRLVDADKLDIYGNIFESIKECTVIEAEE